MKVKKVLIHDNKRFYWKEKDLHTQHGLIKEKDLKKSKAKSNLNKEFTIFNAKFTDNLKKLKRGPASISLKDIGTIIAYTGINKNSKVIDSGTGSGFLASCLANISKEVITYEKNKEFLKIAKENFKSLNLNNIKIKNKNIKEINEKNIDLITLDLPNPHEYLKDCHKSLKNGAFLVTYLPSISQVKELLDNIKDNFIHERTIETLQRTWKIEDKILRPNHHMLAHTAFITFLRKI